MVEWVELLTYISKDSPQNAAAMRVEIAKRLDQLRTFPLIGHADANAVVPPGAGAYITTVEGVAIYYLFPMRQKNREIVFVITIRRGSRMPLEDPAYLSRWMEELAKLAPPPEEPSTD